MNVLRVAVFTIGCRSNQADSAWLGRALDPGAIEVVGPGQPADAVVINSCAVTHAAERDVRRAIAAARAASGPGVRVVLTGCMVTAAADRVADLGPLWAVVPSAERGRIPALLASLVGDAAEPAAWSHPVPRPLRRLRPLLRVQDGCDHGCSYCVVPAGRGAPRSLDERGVLERLDALAREGAREVVVCGVDLGSWGRDLAPRRGLADLLRLLEAEAGVDRIRLGSIEPWALDPVSIEVLAASRRLAPHLHLPVQSGDDAVLRRMGRPYDGRWFRDLVATLVSAWPGVAIGTDAIAGFPGEGPTAFDRTLALVEELPVASVHVFGFSPRPGTSAAALDGRVSRVEIDRRVARLRAAGEAAQARFARSLVGREVDVLVQRRSDATGRLWGVTGQFVRAWVDGPDSFVNRFARILVQGTARDHHLEGRVLRVD